MTINLVVHTKDGAEVRRICTGRYFVLLNGDLIQDRDELYDPIQDKWRRVSPAHFLDPLMRVYNSDVHYPIRRAIPRV